MIDIIITVILEVAKCLAPPLPSRFRFDYLRNYKTNFDKLDQEVGKLKNARDQVQGKVDIAVRKLVEKIKPEVEEWQNDVQTIIDEAKKLIEEKTNSRCFCPNLRKRHKQSKEALRKVESITKLLQREEIFGKVSDPTIPDPVWLTSRNKDYEDFQSRSETLKDIWKALDDVNVPMIGVHGMGGIGKTTLVKEIGRQANDVKLFDDVVFVEITDNPNIKYIQEEIAGYLGLNLSDAVTGSQRASKLHARLKNEKKILLILDNIWKADFNLEEVGIVFGNDQKGCKLLFTARERNIFEGSKTFHISSLGEEEALRLFKKNTGDYFETQEFKSLANDVVKQCGGLPIAIVTIAKALRRKRHPSQWKEALRRLKRSSPTKFEGEYANAYKCIELSYNYLRDDELKKTFLLCCLIRPGASILDLLKYGIGLDIFQSTYTMEEARDKVVALIHDLKDSSLLLDHQDHQRFSIHDFVREVAVSIAIREKNVFYVRNGTQWEWPRKDNYRKIFITDDNFSQFPNELECPQLESLFIMKNSYWRSDSLVDIPEKFFTKMVSLKVLDLIGMQLPSLSSSLHLLVNIQTLSLKYCKFEDIAIIGKLQKLKILSLRGSNFEQLPSAIGQLVHLRLLDLRNCRELKVIAPKVIKCLSQLEELCLRGCPVQWENACLEELSHLSKLSSLEIDIKDGKILPEGFFAKKLERYKISIGSFFDYPLDAQLPEVRSRRALKLELKSSICLKESQSIKNVEFLYLDKLQGVANDILSELDKDGFSQLKHLCLKNNHQFMCIVDSKNLVAGDAFPDLEGLFLSNLSNLEKICRGQFTTGSFCKLKSIEVEMCDKLKNLSFAFSTAVGFQRIQKIKVSSCKKMEEIFVTGGEDGVDNNNEVIDKMDFSEMQSVTLEDLPQFTSFYSRTSVKTPKTLTSSEALSNEIVPEDRLDTATSLFNEKVVFPKLEVLELKHMNFEKIWDSQTTMSSSYKNLTRLILKNCQKLKSVFSSSEIKVLVQLQHLEISECNVLKEIIAEGGGAEEAKFEFPRVTYLKLWKLQELRSFYPGIHTSEWPMLNTLKIGYCEKVNVFSSGYEEESHFDISRQQSLFWDKKVVFPKLEVLELKHMNFEKIWDSHFSTMSSSYKNLTELILENCQKLKSVFSSSMIMVLAQLQHLEISECNVLREIIAEGGGAEEAKFEFPRVTYLKLWKLQELRSFYPGIHTSEWPMLKTLEIGYCEKVNVFSSEYEEESHFDISRQKSLFWDRKVVFPKLEVLLLKHMNFEKIWDSQFSTMSYSYKNLTRLILENCQKLKSVFSSSMITVLAQLQHLEISECNVLKEIIAEGGGAEEAKFEFPRVTYLRLWKLQELRTFYPGIHTSEWPILKTLEIGYCEKVNIFSSEYEEESHFDISSQQSLFLAEKINPNLKKLRLGGKNITMVCKGQFPENHFSKLTIAVEGYNESTNIPLTILKKLEKLCLQYTSHKEIFSSRENGIDDVRATQIKVLQVSYLFYLKNMWKQDSKLDSLLQNLEILKVEGCYKLMTVVPPSASFRNLTTLEVSYSDGLTSLITSSTAKSLEQLKEMKINDCKRVIEVVANEEHVVKDEIVFHELKLLSLKRLSTLICFYSGNHTLKFPSLEELIVEECPNMTYFSGGVLTAPNLQKAKLFKSDMKGPWEGDLNTTIQQLHKTVVNSNSEKLTWQGQFPEHFSSLGLTVLEVIKDESSNIPLKILQRFNNLEKLILKSSSYKEIFSSEEGDSVLQNFKILEVHHCHNLKILATSLASFENLTTLQVYYCDGLRNLVTASTAKGLVRLERMTIAYCELMIEVVENREDEARDDEIVFNKLKFLSLTGLESLTSFCSGNFTFDFPALTRLAISNCPKVKVFSVGVLNTPKLHYLTIGKGMNSRRLKVDDVNTTIQEFYKSEWSDF